jgi:hypothetical protein
MRKILFPVASESAAAPVAQRAIALYRRAPAEIHLINVQHPLPRHVSQFFPGSEVRAFLHDAGMAALAPAIRALDEAAIPHCDHVVIGHAAKEIVRFSESEACDEIVFDEPAGLWSRLQAGSICSQVRHLQQSRGPVPRNA